MKDINIVSAYKESITQPKALNDLFVTTETVERLIVYAFYKKEAIEIFFFKNKEKNKWKIKLVDFSNHERGSIIENHFYVQKREEEVGENEIKKIEKEVYVFEKEILNHTLVRLKTIV